MKRTRPSSDSDASLSFLDIIACAFGAIVLLVLILPVGERSGPKSGVQLGEYGALLLSLADRRETATALETQLSADRTRADALADILSARKNATSALADLVAHVRAQTEATHSRIAAARDARQPQPSTQPKSNTRQPSDYAGIPVDSEYVAIVVDTSGSMRRVWPEVLREVDNVLSIYPEIKGFQVLSASGEYLWKPRNWINDSAGNRGVAKAMLPSWPAYSASNPEAGILTAVRDLYRSRMAMAIFVFGDDYMGTDYDNFLDAVRTGVDHHASPDGTLRIHAFGFRSEAPVQRAKYATLMRELTRRHDGAFLALSN